MYEKNSVFSTSYTKSGNGLLVKFCVYELGLWPGCNCPVILKKYRQFRNESFFIFRFLLFFFYFKMDIDYTQTHTQVHIHAHQHTHTVSPHVFLWQVSCSCSCLAGQPIRVSLSLNRLPKEEDWQLPARLTDGNECVGANIQSLIEHQHTAPFFFFFSLPNGSTLAPKP